MTKQEHIKIFETIRDILYSIPMSLDGEIRNCVGKNRKLMDVLKKDGYEVRWRVCMYRWQDMSLPEEVKSVAHDDHATHAYLEVLIDDEWKTVDATWDKGLEKVFPISEWDGASDTVIAVPVTETYSPEKSAEIMNTISPELFAEDMKVNGEFYRAFNAWLENIRK